MRLMVSREAEKKCGVLRGGEYECGDWAGGEGVEFCFCGVWF